MRSTMMRDGLSLTDLLERAGRLHGESQFVSRLPDKSLRRHTFAEYYKRTRQLASALVAAGLKRGERVATLCWNHYAHLAGAFAKWQLPDRVEFLEAIPRTSTGKFWKVKLREMFR